MWVRSFFPTTLLVGSLYIFVEDEGEPEVPPSPGGVGGRAKRKKRRKYRPDEVLALMIALRRRL
jgi:hypothetical protein